MRRHLLNHNILTLKRKWTEEAVEEMDAVTGQIIADVPFAHSDLVEVIVSDAPIPDLKPLKRLIYQRKE